MNLMIKTILGLIVLGVPAAAVIQGTAVRATVAEVPIPGGASVRGKDQTRPVERPVLHKALFFGPPVSGSAAEFGGPGPVGRPLPPPHGFMGPPPPPPPLPPPTRSDCENRLDGEAAMAGFLTSRLRLSTDQRQAWKKVEDAAQPALDRLHAACDRLPEAAHAAANLPDALESLEAETAARLDLIRATREPLRALYATLTPEQRAMLQPPMPPTPPMGRP